MENLKFKVMRDACGLSQSECADWLQVNKRTLARWEGGQEPIPAHRMAQLMDLFLGQARWLKKCHLKINDLSEGAALVFQSYPSEAVYRMAAPASLFALFPTLKTWRTATGQLAAYAREVHGMDFHLAPFDAAGECFLITE